MKIKNFVKIILFSAIFLLVINRVYKVLSWKDTAGDYYSSINTFYELDDNMVDVMFFGTSRCYCSVDPSYLWNKYGISSFNMAVSGQDIVATYYTMKEAFKTQSPEVVFVELYGVLFDGYGVEGNLYRNTLPFRYSVNSHELVNNVVTDEYSKEDFLLKWPIVHTRYAELKQKDFLSDPPVYLGYHGEFSAKNIADVDIYEGDEMIPLPEEREKWLRKIIQLAEDNDTNLCFFVAPYEGWMADQKTLLYAESIAQEYDIPVLNLLKHKDKLNINVNEDFLDWAHTNHSGAQKVTKYIGKYLAANYELVDHREDEKYALWDENSRLREHEVQNHQLKQMYNVGGYLDTLSCMKDYVVVISTAGEHLTKDADISEYLLTLGIGKEFYEENSCVWVFEDGKLAHMSSEADSFYHMDLAFSDLVVSRSNGENSVVIDFVQYQTVDNGINIVVYDKALGVVVDKVGFSAPDLYGVAR